MPYLLEFTLMGLPKTTNAGGRAHWIIKAKEAKLWKSRVGQAVIVQKAKPKEPLRKAILILTRYSSMCPDFDGLVSSFKHVIDGLVDAGVIINDNIKTIGRPTYLHANASPGKGKVVILVQG